MVKKIRRYVYSFWHDPRTWQTDRQPDRQTDRHCITAIAALMPIIARQLEIRLGSQSINLRQGQYVNKKVIVNSKPDFRIHPGVCRIASEMLWIHSISIVSVSYFTDWRNEWHIRWLTEKQRLSRNLRFGGNKVFIGQPTVSLVKLDAPPLRKLSCSFFQVNGYRFYCMV